MDTPTWLFSNNASGVDELPPEVVQATEDVIAALEKLAVTAEDMAGVQVLNYAPDLYDGPVPNQRAAQALLFEACGTWLWGQLHSGPDRQALLDTMSN